MAAFVYLTPDKKESRDPSNESRCTVTSREDRSRSHDHPVYLDLYRYPVIKIINTHAVGPCKRIVHRTLCKYDILAFRSR